VLTLGGEIQLSRRYFWSKSASGLYPVDEAVGIDSRAVSPGAREICCSMGIAQDFAQGVADLQRITAWRISKERLRQITEGEGQVVEAERADGPLSPSWTADEAVTGPQGPSRVYLGADGVKVRTVTQEEKDRRRQEHIKRRQQRGRRKIGNLRPLPQARPGSDDRFKEMKIGLFYSQDKTLMHMFATHGDHEAFGELLRKHADAIELQRAREKLSLTDGGPWIRNQILKHIKHLDAMLLDFYHLSEHMWATAKCCMGEGASTAAWVEAQLHEMKHTGPRPVLAAIDALRKKVRSQAKLKSLRLLRQYIVDRWEMVEYRQAIARGWDIGSGPTEACCKNLTLRLKRTGMKWDTDNASAMMNLVALRESGQWDAYWKKRKTA
jgi:hypothetical protein